MFLSKVTKKISDGLKLFFLICGTRKRLNLLAVGSSLGHVKKYLKYSDHTVDMSLRGKANLKLVEKAARLFVELQLVRRPMLEFQSEKIALWDQD